MRNHKAGISGESPEKIARLFAILLLFLPWLSPVTVCNAELIDGVVAYVDDRAITLSELNETFEKTRKVQPDITRREVLETMVNRMLLLNEARRLRIEGNNDEDLLNEFIELRVKAFVRLREEDIEDYYQKNIEKFKEAPYESVRDTIEHYLMERETNSLLKKQIAGLRAKAYIKILIREPEDREDSG